MKPKDMLTLAIFGLAVYKLVQAMQAKAAPPVPYSQQPFTP